jgi:hypothetical protein
MIAIVVAAMIGGADPSAALIHDFNQCLRQAGSDAKTQKIAPDALVAFMRAHCSSAETPYKASLVTEDVKHGMSHKEAVSDAASIIESYYSERLDDYKVDYKPADQPAASTPKATPPPTPAAQPK